MAYSEQPVQQYYLTFRDAFTGRSKAGYVRSDTPLYQIVEYLEKENILSFPSCYVRIPGVYSLARCGAHFPDVSDIKGVYSGMTLDLDVYQTGNPQLIHSPNFRKSYSLVFYRRKNYFRKEKIEFTCYGYEYPSEFIARMCASGLLPDDAGVRYRIPDWPVKRHPLLATDLELPLCEADPQQGSAFLLQEYTPPSAPIPNCCLYGCPAAALPEQQHALSARTVDIVKYD